MNGARSTDARMASPAVGTSQGPVRALAAVRTEFTGLDEPTLATAGDVHPVSGELGGYPAGVIGRDHRSHPAVQINDKRAFLVTPVRIKIEPVNEIVGPLNAQLPYPVQLHLAYLANGRIFDDLIPGEIVMTDDDLLVRAYHPAIVIVRHRYKRILPTTSAGMREHRVSAVRIEAWILTTEA